MVLQLNIFSHLFYKKNQAHSKEKFYLYKVFKEAPIKFKKKVKTSHSVPPFQVT